MEAHSGAPFLPAPRSSRPLSLSLTPSGFLPFSSSSIPTSLPSPHSLPLFLLPPLSPSHPQAGVGFTLSAVHLAVRSFVPRSISRSFTDRPPKPQPTDPSHSLFLHITTIIQYPPKFEQPHHSIILTESFATNRCWDAVTTSILALYLPCQYTHRCCIKISDEPPVSSSSSSPPPPTTTKNSVLFHAMHLLHQLSRRDNDEGGLSSAMIDLIIALLVLVLVGLLLVGALLILRRKRQNRKRSELPVHNGECTTHQRRLTISAPPYAQTESVLVYDEKRSLMENSSSPPPSPIPEIRITFPEEEDESGKRKSGRVVVVRISDSGGVGLEPCHEELPPYQSSDAERFHSLDIERMGGLKEKEDINRWS